jgi:hypothetical protein
MKVRILIRKIGWRRIAFVAFCVTMIAAGALYLRGGPHDQDYGFGKMLPPAMGMFALLALATPWLVGRETLPPLTGEKPKADSWSQRTAFWAGVAIAVVAAGILWGQRLDKSLWTDEVASLRDNIVGRWKHRNDDQGYFKRPSIADTFFEYNTPNNHSLYSAVTRWTHDRLAGINDTDLSRPYFSEPVLRLPALIAALVSLPLIGYLALRLGSLLAAWLAMSWAVLHPWYLEFATSARGYSFAMCFIALAVVAAVRIFKHNGGWRWWVVYGLGQFLAFFSVSTVVHALILLNIAVFAGLLFDRSVVAKARRGHLCAFFALNLSAATLAFVTFMPKHLQFHDYLTRDHFGSEMKWGWMEDCMSNFFVGQPFLTWSGNNPCAFATEQWPSACLILAILLAAISMVMALRRGWRGGVFTLLLAIAMLAPPFTVYFQAHAMQFYFFPWYSSWQLPLWLVFFSIGAASLIAKISKRRPAWVAPSAIGILILAIGFATQNQRHAFLSIPVEQQRESAALMRDSPNPYAPGHEEIITISIAIANHAYDPWNRRVHNVDQLWEIIALAESSERPLFCDTAWNDTMEIACADLLTNPDYFQPVGESLLGLQVQNTRDVFKYIPGSLKEQLAERDSP